ncbi:MAG: hypothetical protein WA916_08735 [Arcobacter sp.]|uniref:hypothetical protein n=1 Tax=Arcobacter sp. TaxID=1872629 RepID=UPI003C735839
MIRFIKRKLIKRKLEKRHQLKRRIQEKCDILIVDKGSYAGSCSIKGYNAREFNYLLQYLLLNHSTLNKYTTIEEYNFKRLAKHYSSIRELIQDEMNRDRLQEEKVRVISRESALSNMKILQSILYAITKSEKEFHELK